MSTFTVTLAHVRNPDITGGYWTAPRESGRAPSASGALTS